MGSESGSGNGTTLGHATIKRPITIPPEGVTMERNEPEPPLLTRISQLFASQGNTAFSFLIFCTGSITVCILRPDFA